MCKPYIFALSESNLHEGMLNSSFLVPGSIARILVLVSMFDVTFPLLVTWLLKIVTSYLCVSTAVHNIIFLRICHLLRPRVLSWRLLLCVMNLMHTILIGFSILIPLMLLGFLIITAMSQDMTQILDFSTGVPDKDDDQPYLLDLFPNFFFIFFANDSIFLITSSFLKVA